MNPHDAFLHAVLAHPDDDSPRLIYADWLEEQGDVRAEFVRIQCALWGMEEYHPDFRRLRRRELELLRRHKSEWLGPIAAMTFEAKLHRGFVREITVGPRQFLRRHEELFRLAPIQRLNLARITTETAREIAACPGLSRIAELRLAGSGMDGDAVAALFASPHWNNLRKFTWRGELHSAAGAALTDLLPRLRLEELSFEGVHLGAAGASLFQDAVGDAALQRLDLSSCGIGDYGARRLATSRWLGKLRRSNLASNAVGDEGLRALAASELPRTLERLDLSQNTLQEDGLHDFIAAMDRPILRALNLSLNALRPTQFAFLAKADGVRLLEHLDLSHVKQLDAPTIRELAESFSLTTLRLYNCQIGTAGAIEIARSPRSQSLRVLDLNDNAIDDAGADAILDSPHLGNLTRLDLRGNAIERDRQRALRRRFGPGVCTFSR